MLLYNLSYQAIIISVRKCFVSQYVRVLPRVERVARPVLRVHWVEEVTARELFPHVSTVG